MTFAILDAKGRTLATVDDVLVALPLQRHIDDAEDVVRVEDGVVIAKKSRTRVPGCFWQSLWNMTREPETEA